MGETYATPFTVDQRQYSALQSLTRGTEATNDDRAAVLFSDGTLGLALARANVTDPRSASAWSPSMVVETGNVVEDLCLTDYAGRAVAFWIDRSLGRVVIAHALGDEPSGPQDWGSFVLDIEVTPTAKLEVPRALLDNRLIFLLRDTSGVIWSVASTQSPWTSAEWVTYDSGGGEFFPFVPPDGFERLLTLNCGDDFIDMVYKKPGSTMPMFARTLQYPPQSPDDWFVEFMVWGTSTNGIFSQLTRAGDRTEVFYGVTQGTRITTGLAAPTPYDWVMERIGPSPPPLDAQDRTYSRTSDGCFYRCGWDDFDGFLKVVSGMGGCDRDWVAGYAESRGDASMTNVDNHLLVAYRGDDGFLWIGNEP